HSPPSALHSFPTRRSSDLRDSALALDNTLRHTGLEDQPFLLRDRFQALGRLLVGGRLEHIHGAALADGEVELVGLRRGQDEDRRSEEHTSELQSLAYLVCR